MKSLNDMEENINDALTISDTLITQSKLIATLERYIKWQEDYVNGFAPYSEGITIREEIEHLKSILK